MAIKTEPSNDKSRKIEPAPKFKVKATSPGPSNRQASRSAGLADVSERRVVKKRKLKRRKASKVAMEMWLKDKHDFLPWFLSYGGKK